ncbi:MAG TPA: exopolysaccharide biosynthesis protein [Opitutaceae bacterium]|nr:exopolysaccharide biosynthesis protein [Opitutaceae bacterium]
MGLLPRRQTAKRKSGSVIDAEDRGQARGTRQFARSRGVDSLESPMSRRQKPTNLGELLEAMSKAEDGGNRVRMRAVFEAVGTRSYGPLLLLGGLITLAPVVGDIPGVPTGVGVFIVLISGQLLWGRDHFWLPGWMLNRSAPRAKFRKALGWMRRPAQFTDKFLRNRLPFFTSRPALRCAALVCILIGGAMPMMEFVPFSANAAGAALTAFGLSFVAKDGLLALIAFVFAIATFGISALVLT